MAAKDLYEKDFYKILGVDKTASASEIKKKYRTLARELHPDKNKGDKKLEEQFKAVSEAYDILSDDKTRKEYDEARSLFAGGGFRSPQGGGSRGPSRGGDIFDDYGGGTQDIFANLFGGRRGPRKGQDLETESTITFRESVLGTTLDLRLAIDGGSPQNITARVPAGVQDGTKIRLKGKGGPGEAGPGDLFIHLHVKPHPIFARTGENITMVLPVTFAEATLGADVLVPTFSDEEVLLRLPPGTPNRRVLRIKGRGIHKGNVVGDLLVTVEIQVPRHVNAKAQKALEDFAEATSAEDVRVDLKSRAHS
ncbi:MAG TPA: DnaJ C-terminal domain-containing protein [Candidatus Nanopelagicaceae bacterium]